MPSTSKIKFAVIGYGHIGKRHAAVIEKNPDAELVALCDVAEGSGQWAVGSWQWAVGRGQEAVGSGQLAGGSIPFFASLDELLGSGTEIDVVCIATPNGLHEEQALKVLKAGHHVVI